jgi:hypothetical protein
MAAVGHSDQRISYPTVTYFFNDYNLIRIHVSYMLRIRRTTRRPGRSEQIAEWIKLTDEKQQQQPAQVRPHLFASQERWKHGKAAAKDLSGGAHLRPQKSSRRKHAEMKGRFVGRV